jgi:hypothetical protein
LDKFKKEKKMLNKVFQLKYCYGFIALSFLLLSTNAATAQTNRMGSYIYKISKDGYQATMKLYVYGEGDEVYGRMRIEDGGQPWEVNLWTLKNGDYIDFYYEMNIDNPLFTQDTHIMTIGGDGKKPLAVFGKEMKAKIKQLKPADVMSWESEEPTFTIKEKAKSQTIEIKGEEKKN